MNESVEREPTPRRQAHRAIRDYRDATGCSRLRATFHWASVCLSITAQVVRKQAPVEPAETIELVNFVLEYEAMDADLSGEER